MGKENTMTTFQKIAEIINQRGFATTTSSAVKAVCEDYDGLNETKANQDAWLAETSDEEIAIWVEGLVSAE
jgi:predicted DNA-binding ribbon-helix-helix protein